MTIVLAGNTTIADGIEGSSVVVGPILLDGQALGDKVSAIGAAGIAVYDRTTKEHAVEFTVDREHGSVASAQKHVWAVRQAIPAKATLDVRETYASGLSLRWKATEALWRTTRAQAVGVSSQVVYRVECGVIVPTVLADPADEVAEDPEILDVLRDPLLNGSYGPTPGVIVFPPPWHPGVHSNAAVTSTTLADMAP